MNTHYQISAYIPHTHQSMTHIGVAIVVASLTRLDIPEPQIVMVKFGEFCMVAGDDPQ